MTAISKGDLAYTGPEIITSHRLREIEQLICDLFTHQRQVDTIFFTQFHATHGSYNFGPSTLIVFSLDHLRVDSTEIVYRAALKEPSQVLLI